MSSAAFWGSHMLVSSVYPPMTGSVKRTRTAWNAFAFVTGIFIPAVWPRFISEGLATWPYLAVFLWLAIFVFESMAFFASVTWYALKDVPA